MRNRIVPLVASALALWLAPLGAVAVAPAPEQGEVTFESTVALTVDTVEGPVEYDAIVTRLELPDSDDANDASFYAYSYIRTDAGDPADRPIAFIFNGGPGSSSVWLHMGFAAPVRLPEAFAQPGVNETVEALDPNPHTLLIATDLVFIDPIGTGFSRATGSDRAYWGVEPDAESVAALVRTYLRTSDREQSPVFLIGESYGAVRAAAMLAPLLEAPAVDVQGVVLISPALQTRMIVSRNTDESLVARLPTFAALAWYHGLVDNEAIDLWTHVERASEFADGVYRRAIETPSELTDEEVEFVLVELTALTGVDREAILDDRLRVTTGEFLRAARRVAGGSIGSLDGRFVASREMSSEIPARTFGSAMRLHLAQTWHIDTDGRYTLMNYRANGRWRGRDGRHVFRSDIATLKMIEAAQRVKPELGLLVVSGVYDIVTPFAGARQALAQSHLDRDQLRVFEYPSGHMIYMEEASHRALSADMRAFIAAPIAAPAP